MVALLLRQEHSAYCTTKARCASSLPNENAPRVGRALTTTPRGDWTRAVLDESEREPGSGTRTAAKMETAGVLSGGFRIEPAAGESKAARYPAQLGQGVFACCG